MATLSPFSTLSCVCRPSSYFSSSSSITPCCSASNLPFQSLRLQIHVRLSNYYTPLSVSAVKIFPRLTKIRSSVAEEQETLIPADEEVIPEEEEEEAAAQPSTSEQPVSVPVSPSDILTMFFQAEGTMTESAIPTVTKALEVNPEIEGISNLKVQVDEGIATVELTKQTTVQATGVASSFVEIIQGSGFKLQTLHLSFEDEEDVE